MLPGLSTQLDSGTVTGLLGPSGSGKSTLIRSIAGVQRIDSGTVKILGYPAGTRAAARCLGYMTQASSVYTDLSVRENVAYWARISGAERGGPAGGTALRRADLSRRPRLRTRRQSSRASPGRAHRRARPGAAGGDLGLSARASGSGHNDPRLLPHATTRFPSITFHFPPPNLTSSPCLSS